MSLGGLARYISKVAQKCIDPKECGRQENTDSTYEPECSQLGWSYSIRPYSKPVGVAEKDNQHRAELSQVLQVLTQKAIVSVRLSGASQYSRLGRLRRAPGLPRTEDWTMTSNRGSTTTTTIMKPTYKLRGMNPSAALDASKWEPTTSGND